MRVLANAGQHAVRDPHHWHYYHKPRAKRHQSLKLFWPPVSIWFCFVENSIALFCFFIWLICKSPRSHLLRPHASSANIIPWTKIPRSSVVHPRLFLHERWIECPCLVLVWNHSAVSLSILHGRFCIFVCLSAILISLLSTPWFQYTYDVTFWSVLSQRQKIQYNRAYSRLC